MAGADLRMWDLRMWDFGDGIFGDGIFGDGIFGDGIWGDRIWALEMGRMIGWMEGRSGSWIPRGSEEVLSPESSWRRTLWPGMLMGGREVLLLRAGASGLFRAWMSLSVFPVF